MRRPRLRALEVSFSGIVVLAALDARPAHGEVFSQPLTVGTYMLYSQPVIALETRSEGGRVEFAAQTRARPGFEVNYGRFGVAMTASQGEAGGSWATPGIPAGGLNDFRIRYHGSAWGFEGQHLSARGFDRESDGRPGVRERENRPGMTLRTTTGTLYRAFDPDTRIYHLSEGIAERGGDLDAFLTVGASHSHVHDDASLLSGLEASESAFASVRDMEVASLAVGGGLAVSSNMAGLYFDHALFGGFGPQYRAWGGHSEVEWDLVRVNLRVRVGVRNRWFDAGVGFENEAHTAFAGPERMVVHAMAAQAKLEVFL